jgi:hypothetical protein
MQPDQVRFLLQRIAFGSFFHSDPYALDRVKRCQQYGTKFDPLPEAGGVYAIRASGDPFWAYVGQSHNLRERIQSLRGVFQEVEMPFTDPHKVSPALWSWLKNQPDLQLEVLIAPLGDMSAYWRQGLEAFVIAWHRWCFGCSPRWQFGRMPRGWSASTERKRGIRGKTVVPEVVLDCHRPGIAPLTRLFDDQSDPLSEYWAGHRWSSWYSSVRGASQIILSERGIYRLQRKDQLLYIGMYRIGLDESGEEHDSEGNLDKMPVQARATSLARIF